MSAARRAIPLGFALALAAAPALAQQPTQQSRPAPVAPATMLGTKGVLQTDLADLESKYLRMAEALEPKYEYRPAEGVRSSAEVLAHIAAANYNIPGVWGTKAPEGVDARAVSQLKDKAQIVEHLKKSFAHVRSALESIPEGELDKPVRLFGQDATARRAQFLIVAHMHEHLGQLIAYARANGIVPPWNAG